MPQLLMQIASIPFTSFFLAKNVLPHQLMTLVFMMSVKKSVFYIPGHNAMHKQYI